MIGIIQNNPYRLVGVYTSSTRREIVANIARIKANLRVNRQVEFQTDLDKILPSPTRTIETIADAESKLTLPKDIIRYAQFWYIETTEFDKIALNNLAVGSIDKAVSIWEKKENLSSVHNRIITYLISCDYAKALELSLLFYTKYSSSFVELILGDEKEIVSKNNLAYDFLDILCDELGASEVSMYITNKEWGEYVNDKLVTPLIDSINRSIAVAKETKKKGPIARLDAGTKLMNDTITILRSLKNELSPSNAKYQVIADKLGLEILQCGIDYYNDSEDDDAAHKAIKLQKYAQSIVVGKMAKDRCDENVRTLENIISKLPPLEIMREHKSIQTALRIFTLQPDLIEHSIQLIKVCVPYLISIKEKLGSKHQYYLKISTTIVNNALGNIIAEVNDAQEKDFDKLKTTLIEAWRTQLYMDKFDLEPQYKEGRYKDSRNSLHNIIDNCKGFESSTMSFMYRYGCGWCNNLDVSDVDLRTDDEYYASCSSISSYETYLKIYPEGKHIIQAKSKIESLTFQAAKTINDYQKFIKDYPNSALRSKAQEAIDKLIQKEKELRNQIERLTKELAACNSISEVINLYENKKTLTEALSKCSIRAFELAKNEDDYQKIVSKFGARSIGGIKAKGKIDEIERKRKENADRRKKYGKWIIWTSIILALFVGIYLIWGVRGFAAGCTGIAVISGFIALGAMQSRSDSGCGTFFIFAAIAAVFGFSASGLHEWADIIEDEKESTEMYERILSGPSIEACNNYIKKFSDTKNADSVREVWLNLLIKNARNFDYSSYEYNIDKKNPIKDIQSYINKNDRSIYSEKAKTFLDLICDSLYKVADISSTASGWRQYQKIVPTDYFKDSDNKIETIENLAWNTEPKAWKQATSENSLSAYKKYKSLYPNGAHIGTCEKRIIDMEVAIIYAGDHGTLPEMDRTGYGGGSTSSITVTNSTSYVLTLLYSGADSKRLVLSPGKTSTIRLKNGSYRVAASVSASNVRNYAGSEQLQGGNYSVDYYISTSRF